MSIANAAAALQKFSGADRARFGDRYTRVLEYFADHQDAVAIEDVSRWLPELIDAALAGSSRPGIAEQGQ